MLGCELQKHVSLRSKCGSVFAPGFIRLKRFLGYLHCSFSGCASSATNSFWSIGTSCVVRSILRATSGVPGPRPCSSSFDVGSRSGCNHRPLRLLVEQCNAFFFCVYFMQ